jgi:ubiquinone/menaquinone biosynthesis C-methylase UbiE
MSTQNVREELSIRACLATGQLCRRLFRFEAPTEIGTPTHDDAYFSRKLGDGKEFLGRFPPMAGLEALEIGCGHGGMLEALAEAGAMSRGIDPDPHRVAFAQSKGLAASVAPAESLPFADATFDAIVCDEVIEHLADVGTALREAFRVLRPGGHFYGVWGPAWLTYNGPHLIKCISVPWVQLWFSDQTIIHALERQREESVWPRSYLDYKIEDFERMGRVTRAKLRDAATRSGFVVEREESRSRRRVKQWLSGVRPFDELLAGELTVVLRRP